MRAIEEGDSVLLYLSEKKKWLVQVRDRKEFHTHVGVVKLEEAVGKPFGSCVRSTLGFEFYLLWPTVRDRILHTHRPTQILYDKDVGLAIFRLGIGPGDVVIEAGTGSGAMTASLANVVRPGGHVYSYEIREEFVETATRNLVKMGLEEYVTINNLDARNGFREKDVDAAFIDLGDPWEVIGPVHLALGGGHPVASFSPTMNQVEKVVDAMKNGFVDIETVECFVRSLRVEKGKTRPTSLMVGHTGYLTFGRKVFERKEQVGGSSR